MPRLLLPIVLALLPHVSTAQLPPAITLVPTDEAGFVGLALDGPIDQPVAVTGPADFDRVFGASSAGLSNPHLRGAVHAFFFEGGAIAHVVRASGAPGGVASALDALRDVDTVSMVAVPGDATQATQTLMIAHCEQMGDRLAILDAVESGSASAVRTQRAALGSPNGMATLYTPWLEGFVDGVPATLPPSGSVAGVWARTSPHRSPAGTTSGTVFGAVGVAVDYTTGEIDLLAPEGINPIRSFPGQGILVWGARTLATDPEWTFVAVRRQVTVLEESILEGTTWVLDAPADATTWAAVESQVDALLFSLFVDGWFTGVTAEEAYFVRCGLGETMTQADIDAGRTIVLVGVAPLRPAEFVTIQIVQESVVVDAPPRPQATEIVVAPNPFNPRTSVRFDLERDASVELDLVDLSGRHVRTLRDREHLGAGRHAVVWDGRDDGGAPVASGSYVVRLRAGRQTSTARVTLIR